MEQRDMAVLLPEHMEPPYLMFRDHANVHPLFSIQVSILLSSTLRLSWYKST